MKKRSALILVVIWCFLAGCDNGTGTSGNGTPFTGPTSIEEVIEYLADKKQDGSDPDKPVELAVRISGSEWEQLFDAIIQADKFVALDLSRCYNVPQEFNSFNPIATPFANDKVVSLIFPTGITSIVSDSFHHCTNLRQITLPVSLTLMHISAFYECTGLELVICHAAESPTFLYIAGAPVPWETDETLFYNTSPNLAIRVPAKSVAAYKAAWPTWANRIGPI